MRRPFVAGNWKMNLDLASARALVAELREKVGDSPPIDVAVCPPSIYLFPAAKWTADSPIQTGAQNCWHEPKGAFTGEVSAAMVKEAGCAYVILGHSERRHTIGPRDAAGQIHAETDEMVAAKVRAAMGGGLVPIVCVGETLDERDKGQTQAVLHRQLAGSLAGVDVTSADAMVVAYEPVWAIGTGRNATPDQAQEAHKYIRGRLGERFGAGVADGIRIQYGGSVKPENVAELMACPDVDGALVGGASLKAADFVGIIEGTARAKGLC
ncbi:MAG: triose-phosphate isomerase [Phycisphaerae bacterium]|nr:triose-phosphate isomerase [Phycisphaerae bacterium]